MMRLFYRGNSRVMSVNILTAEREGGMVDVLQSGSKPPHHFIFTALLHASAVIIAAAE